MEVIFLPFKLLWQFPLYSSPFLNMCHSGRQYANFKSAATETERKDDS